MSGPLSNMEIDKEGGCGGISFSAIPWDYIQPYVFFGNGGEGLGGRAGGGGGLHLRMAFWVGTELK